MIGLVLRSAMGDSMGMCGMVLGPLLAICAVCGIWALCTCRMRDCGCARRFLRATGVDPFDDFEMMILVHKAAFTAPSKTPVYVRIRAGQHEVCTDLDSAGLFQQALSVFVEQGTEHVKFELLNTSNKVIADLTMNVMKEILHSEDGKCVKVTEKTFQMKQKNKHVLNPRVVLTFMPEGPGDEEQALLSGLNASTEVEWMLQQQLQKAAAESQPSQEAVGGAAAKPPEQLSEIALLARGCCGPLHMFGMMGSKSLVYVGVLGPPRRKRFALHVWDNEHDFSADKPSKLEIELLRTSAVAPDPSRANVFTITYIDKSKAQKKAVFQRVDRGRDVWVEMLQILVTKIHNDHNQKKKEKDKGK